MSVPVSRVDPVSFPKSDDEWFSWIIPSTRSQNAKLHDRVKLMADIRKGIEGLRETTTTFKLTDFISNGRARAVPDEMMYYLGSWKRPDTMNSKKNANLWVNPGYKHAHVYTDCVAKCGCGAVTEKFNSGLRDSGIAGSEHTEDCCTLYRYEHAAQILRNRQEAIKQGLLFNHSLRSMAARLGYDHRNFTGGSLNRSYEIDLRELAREGRRREIRTFMVLARDYSPQELSGAFGVSPSEIRRRLKVESNTDNSKLYRIRRNKPYGHTKRGGLKKWTTQHD